MPSNVLSELKQLLPEVQQGVLLKDYTTFNIGGPAEYFFIARSKEALMHAITVARQMQLPLFVFGGGSNLLVSDEGLKGLVVKLQNEQDIIVEGETLTAPAGVSLGRVVDASIEASLEGLEWAGGLPGSFGGAIRGNAGAFGGEMKDAITQVQALDDALILQTYTNEQCEFAYRTSLFKKKNYIVISATLQLKTGDKEKLQAIADSRRQYRNEKHPLEYPSAGSVFKNVDVKDVPPEFLPQFEDKIKKDPFPIVPAAWFIIGAGLTGKRIGDAQISEKHSNYIVNLGQAKASDVLELVNIVKDTVKEKYGIQLEMEVQYVN